MYCGPSTDQVVSGFPPSPGLRIMAPATNRRQRVQTGSSLTYSAEIRWFLQGTAPAGLRDAYFGDTPNAAQRIDEYVLLPGCDATGIKLREGRLEVKARTRAPEAVSYGATIAGRRDGWIKWSRPAADGAALRALVSNPVDDWLFVAKTRRLRKFAPRGRGFVEIEPTELAARGYQAELCALRAFRGRQSGRPRSLDDFAGTPSWYSICVEAFGDSLVSLAELDTAVAHLLAGGFRAELPARASSSYPAWLAGFLTD